MGWVNEKVNAYVNRLVRKQLISKFIAARPLLYFISAEAQSNLGLLLNARKNPNENWNAAVSMGGADYNLAQRMKLNGSLLHELRYQTAQPTGGSNVAPGGNTPVATVFSEDLVGTAGTCWNTKIWPFKVRESTIEAATGDLAIGAVIEEATKMSFNKAFDDRQSDFWNGTLTLAQQNLNEWQDGMIGIRHWCNDGVDNTNYKYVGRVDRTVETILKANVVEASTLQTNGVIPSTVPTLDMLRKIRTIDTYGGIANKDPDSGNLVITTSELWNVLADEADGQHLITSGGEIKGIRHTVGAKFPCIHKDGMYITYDPSCPSGELFMLTTKTWMYEIQGGHNYRPMAEWKKKHEQEEGGGRYRWNNMTLKDRFTCTMPWLQVNVQGLTTT